MNDTEWEEFRAIIVALKEKYQPFQAKDANDSFMFEALEGEMNRWTLFGSFYFALTVVTTIGNVFPSLCIMRSRLND